MKRAELTPFGEAIKNRQKELGLSQKQVADLIGTQQSMVSMYSTGKRICDNYQQITKFADFLNITIEETKALINQKKGKPTFSSLDFTADELYEYRQFMEKYGRKLKGMIMSALTDSPLSAEDKSIAYEIICDYLD